MAIEIDKTLIADDDGSIQVGEAQTIEIAPDEERCEIGREHV